MRTSRLIFPAELGLLEAFSAVEKIGEKVRVLDLGLIGEDFDFSGFEKCHLGVL